MSRGFWTSALLLIQIKLHAPLRQGDVHAALICSNLRQQLCTINNTRRTTVFLRTKM
jgi:hypothetical protein